MDFFFFLVWSIYWGWHQSCKPNGALTPFLLISQWIRKDLPGSFLKIIFSGLKEWFSPLSLCNGACRFLSRLLPLFSTSVDKSLHKFIIKLLLLNIFCLCRCFTEMTLKMFMQLLIIQFKRVCISFKNSGSLFCIWVLGFLLNWNS